MRSNGVFACRRTPLKRGKPGRSVERVSRITTGAFDVDVRRARALTDGDRSLEQITESTQEEIVGMCTCGRRSDGGAIFHVRASGQADAEKRAHTSDNQSPGDLPPETSAELQHVETARSEPAGFVCQPHIQHRATLNDSEQRAGKEHLHATERRSFPLLQFTSRRKKT